MKQISIQDLKGTLSSAIAEAEAGETFIVTRHSDPVAQLGPAGTSHLHHASDSERKRLMPAARRGTKGRYLSVLLDDRGNR